MLHAAAGRAFTRAQRGYHPSPFAQDAVDGSRRRERVPSERDGGRPTSVHVMMRSSILPSASSRGPLSLTADDGTYAGCSVSTEHRNHSVHSYVALPEASHLNRATSLAHARTPVRHANVHPALLMVDEHLSPVDPIPQHSRRSPMLPYKDDPPWPGTSGALNAQPKPNIARNASGPQSRSTIANDDTVWKPSEPLPIPTSNNSLYRILLRLITSENSPALVELINYHTQFRSFQSVRSFNLLIAFSIRSAKLWYASRLFKQMDSQGISGNVETRALRVRHLVRKGYWHTAWREECGTEGEMPLSVWIEFFGDRKRRTAPRKPRVDSQDLDASETPSASDSRLMAEQGSDAVPLNLFTTMDIARFNLLMHKLPSFPRGDWRPNTPRVVRSVISLLLRCEQFKMAEAITLDFFESLAPRLDYKVCSRCLEIIHLHMAKSRRTGLLEFFRIQALMGRMLRTHPLFRPNSKTLALLLSRLKKALRCGSTAWHTTQKFRAQWGSRVVDDRVRRRVASLAVKEGRLDIVEAVMAEQELADIERRVKAKKDEITGEPWTESSKRLPSPSYSTLSALRREAVNRTLFHQVVSRYVKKRTQTVSDG